MYAGCSTAGYSWHERRAYVNEGQQNAGLLSALMQQGLDTTWALTHDYHQL